MHVKNIYFKAFTLAEVLITLMVIGVIAVITIPAILTSVEEREYISQLKKTYSVLQQAYKMAEIEYGTPDNWDLRGGSNSTGAKNLVNNLTHYMKLQKNCQNDTTCLTVGPYYQWGTANTTITFNTDFNTNLFAKAILIDGSYIMASSNPGGADCSIAAGTNTMLNKQTCGLFYVDINGYKKPNFLGKDLFGFWLTKNGIVPFGVPDSSSYSLSSYCNKSVNRQGNGLGCTAWVLYRNNMDYLTDNVSW